MRYDKNITIVNVIPSVLLDKEVIWVRVYRDEACGSSSMLLSSVIQAANTSSFLWLEKFDGNVFKTKSLHN